MIGDITEAYRVNFIVLAGNEEGSDARGYEVVKDLALQLVKVLLAHAYHIEIQCVQVLTLPVVLLLKIFDRTKLRNFLITQLFGPLELNECLGLCLEELIVQSYALKYLRLVGQIQLRHRAN